MASFTQQIDELAGGDKPVGVILVDHGSRREQSNLLLNGVAAMFRLQTRFELVEPAHMELAEPSIATAFDRCVERGARLVVVFPYFLSPGRHWSQDIPRLAAEAAAKHPGVEHLVTQPLGLHTAMAQIMQDRITHCMAHALGDGDTCDLCRNESGGCVVSR